MQESNRTLVFIGAALVSLAVAAATHWSTQPASLAEFSDVGEPFYPDFEDPNVATGLRVAAYNDDAAKVDVFDVEFKEGLWRIPSHHNYPADGEEQLSKTAASIVGITRGAIASTSPDDFKRLGVLDPLDQSLTGTEGRGDRITLLEGDNILADYIIGTKVEDQNNVYHIRRADEDRTYRATLDISISTKFADWIQQDLLSVQRAELRQIVVDKYSVDETRGVLIPGEQSKLSRPNATDPWTLDGLGEGQEVNTTNVNSVINALEELKIVGVRPKPPGLSADLKGEREGGARVDTMAILDLEEKGYFIDREGALVSNEGEVRVGTEAGVLYVLRFGEVFTGTDVDIEVGDGSGTTDATKSEDDPNASTDGGESEDAEGEDDVSRNQSRYLFITTQFHDALVEPPGEKPVEPTKPAADESTEESEADAEVEGDDTPEESPTDADAEYQQALADYQTQLKQWEQQEAAYQTKLEEGRAKVQELNARFADWYYVISAKAFDEIRVDRETLIKVEEPSDESADGPALDSSSPQSPPADQPTDEPMSDSTEPEDLPSIDEETLPVEDPDFTKPTVDTPESGDNSTE